MDASVCPAFIFFDPQTDHRLLSPSLAPLEQGEISRFVSAVLQGLPPPFPKTESEEVEEKGFKKLAPVSAQVRPPSLPPSLPPVEQGEISRFVSQLFLPLPPSLPPLALSLPRSFRNQAGPPKSRNLLGAISFDAWPKREKTS